MKNIYPEPHQEPATWILERLPKRWRARIIRSRFPFMKISLSDGKVLKDETWYDRIPQGWRWSFGYSFCNDLRKAFVSSGVNPNSGISLRLKEKLGVLDVTFDSPCPEEVLSVLSKYTKLSRKTCIECGNAATGTTRAWILPYCEDCFKSIETDRRRMLGFKKF